MVTMGKALFNRLTFSGLYDDGENFWVTMFRFNALFKINKKSFKAEYKGSFPNESATIPCLYIDVAFYDGKLYFAPHQAKEIAGYDIESGVFFKISVPSLKKTNESARFISLFQYDRYIFFARENGVILRYSPKDGGLQYFDCLGEDKDIRFGAVCTNENVLVLASNNTKSVLIFNMDSCESDLNYIAYERGEFSGICFDGNNYWLSPLREGNVIKWNGIDKNCETFSDYPKDFAVANGKQSFFSAHYVSGFVWLFPQNANMALKINVCDGTFSVAEEFQQKLDCAGDTIFLINYLFATVSGNIIYAFVEKTNEFVSLDTKNGEVIEKTILFDFRQEVSMKPLITKAIAEIFEKTCFVTESTISKEYSVGLSSYIDFICCDRCLIQNPKRNVHEIVGGKIYEYVKNLVITKKR